MRSLSSLRVAAVATALIVALVPENRLRAGRPPEVVRPDRVEARVDAPERSAEEDAEGGEADGREGREVSEVGAWDRVMRFLGVGDDDEAGEPGEGTAPQGVIRAGDPERRELSTGVWLNRPGGRWPARRATAVPERPPPPGPVLPGIGAEGEEPWPEEWTLDLALARALRANPELAEARLALERQGGAEREAWARLLPQVSIEAGASLRDESLIDRSPGELLQPPSRQTAIAEFSYDSRVEIRQLLFDGFAAWNLARREEVTTELTAESLRLTAYRIAALVKQGYDGVYLRQSGVAVAERRVELLTQLEAWASRRREVGDVTQLEAWRAQAELKQAEADLLRARRDLAAAQAYLARLLYLDLPVGGSERLRVPGPAPRVADAVLTEREAIETALERRLDLKVARLQVEVAERTLKAAQAARLPRVEAYGNYGVRSSYYDSERELNGWTVGVAGRWDLFDGMASSGRERARRVDVRTAEARLQALELRVQTDLKELFHGLAQAKAALVAQLEAQALATRTLSSARRLYELGQANLQTVLEAEYTLRRTEVAAAEADYQVGASLAQIEFSVGGVLPGGRDVGREVLP